MNKDYLKELGDQIAMAHWAKSNEKTYEEICDRVVNYICDDPSEEGRHYNHRMKDLLKSKKFIPNSPCWINAGTDMKNLFACYVIDLQDNMSSIMDTAKRMAMIMKEGGGVGVSLTPIREEGARVGGEGSERTASGPISFLKVFDAVVGAVKSAGVRRGAALANLKVGHPDLIKFIKCKEDQNQINNFNLSVAITDEFMDDVINKSDRVWAVHEQKLYTATEIYDLIVEHMWRNGEPGVQFIDAFNNVDGKYTGRPEFIEFNTGLEVTNPCGETALKPNEACNLGSINLYHFVNPFWKGKDENKDMALRQELKQTVEDAVDFLNKMLDKSETPFPEINEAVKKSRKVGLGVMGLADYLSAKGIVYGSPEAVHEAADIFAFITKTAEEHSLRKGYKNATLTVQAPTGTTGLVGEVSTGIEPHFLRCWSRHSIKMGDLLMYPKSLRDYIVSRRDSCRVNDHNYICWVALEKAMNNNDMGRFSNLVEGKEYYNGDHSISDEIKRYWPTAHEVTPKQHLAMLAAIQRHVHNSVSKTINLPHDATVEDVRELIMTAWRTGVKGFTCYRDGSRDSQPLKSIDSESKDKIETNDDLINHIRLDMTEKKRLEYLEKMSDKEPIFADTILKALAFDKVMEGIDKTLLPAENIILSDTADSKIFADKIRSKMADDLRKELEDEDGEKTTLTKHEYEVLSKFAELGYEYVVDCYSDKLATDVLKEHPEIRINKKVSQEQKASCKRPRPAVTHGESIRTKIGCGTMYITVNRDDKGICEVFTSLGRSGGCPSQSEATSRLISLALRSGVSLDDIIDQLKGIRCLNTMRQGGMKQEDGTIVLSCPDAIGKAIEKVREDEKSATANLMKHFIDDPDSHISDEDLFKAIFPDSDSYISDEKLKASITLLHNKGMSCPKCGEQMDRDGGCVICRHCGYSKCG